MLWLRASTTKDTKGHEGNTLVRLSLRDLGGKPNQLRQSCGRETQDEGRPFCSAAGAWGIF